MYNRIIAVGALLTALGIVFGAFGAHALRDTLSLYGHEIFKTASLYHLIHGLAIVCLAPLGALGFLSSTAAKRVAALFAFGVVVFSGSLYLLAITEIRWLGAITPIGGLSFIIGWLLLGLSALRAPRSGSQIDPPTAQG